MQKEIKEKPSQRIDQKAKQSEEIEFIEDIVSNVTKDYTERARARQAYESQWQLNSNFALGNQYCAVNVSGAVEDTERDYFWQEREVFNHIAPIIETRLAKLNRVRPKMSVRPASGDDDDVKAGKMSSKILTGACNKLELDQKIANATYWSELAGTSFYKITWDKMSGKCVGRHDKRDVYEGDIKIDVCPPYEIFPSSLSCHSIDELQSIIHAKAVDVDEIKRIYGCEVEPQNIDVVSVSNISVVGGLGLSSAVPSINRGLKENSALVIERYSRPTLEKPDGEFAVVAGEKLLYYGALPYRCGEDNKFDLPFVKQESIVNGACFYGTSMIERAIPIQRAYNAVKNRKHEFMNRIAMGVMTVEDGSVDMENLVDEGLSPGKILVYRQGSTPPRLLDAGRVPSDFGNEEDRLLTEFIAVSGVSEIMRSSSVPSSLSSGTALQILIEQDDTRLSVTAELIRNAVRKVAKNILRLYKQFVSGVRLSRIVGSEGEAEIICWNASDLTCDDVVFDTENELNTTPASKQNMMFELLKMGLLHDEDGKLSDAMRYKILDVLGYGGWEITKDIASLHIARAEKENLNCGKEDVQVLEIDDHKMHINTHTKYALSNDFQKLCKKQPKLKDKMLEHIKEHKRFSALEKNAEAMINGQQ